MALVYRIGIYISLLTTCALLAGCAKRVPLTAATSVPAAAATADLTHDRNGNTIVELRVKHLAKPENLTPAKKVYVVWIQPTGSSPIKEGQLQVNNNLETRFRTPTTYKDFSIFLTAEDSAAVEQPTGQEVLRSQVTRS
jgi:hypothetical protein